VGFGASSECSGFASARPPLLRPGPFKKEPGRSWSSGSASRGVLAPPDTVYVGCPFSATRSLSVARVGRELPHSRRCRPQGSCPSRRFRLARGSLEVFWTPPFAVAPDASRPFFMPLASLELPSRAFPSRGAAPALAGRFFLAGSRSTVAGAVPAGASRSLSPLFAPALCPRTRPKADPGLMSRDDGSLRSLVRSPRPARWACRTCRPHPTDTGLAGKLPARPLRSFTPPGSPFCDDPDTWPGRDRPSVLSWDSYPPELSPPRFWVRSLAKSHAGDSRSRATCSSGRPAIAVAFRDPDSDAWVREPRIRRYARSIEPAYHRQAATQLTERL